MTMATIRRRRHRGRQRRRDLAASILSSRWWVGLKEKAIPQGLKPLALQGLCTG